MSNNVMDIATAVSSVVGGALSDVNCRVMDQVLTMEEFPQVNIRMPSWEVDDPAETIGGSATHFIRYTVPVICYEWDEDRVSAQTRMGALVNSVTNALRTHGNRTLNDLAGVRETYLLSGASLDEDDEEMGIMTAYELTLSVVTEEGA